jgi:hypothetical protein
MFRNRIWRVLPLALVALAACASPSYVDRIEIVNPTEYDLVVAVKGTETADLRLGIAKKGEGSIREQVIDMGEDWTFTFSYLGEQAGEASVDRSELERVGWRFVIPEEVGERLKQRGVQPSY